MMNPILERWRDVWTVRRDEPAIFAASGEVLRTFREVEEEACEGAALLGGLPAGSVIGVHSGASPSWPAQVLAVWKQSGVVLPLDGEMAGDRLNGIVRRSGMRGIFRGPGQLTSLPQKEVPGRVGADLLKLTSGSSAEPRLVRFSAAQLLADCESICRTMGLRDDDRNYGLIPFAHSYGFSNLITPLLCRGIPLVIGEDLLPRAILAGLRQSRATVLPAVPAIFRALAGIPPEPLSLRLCISAGAPIARTDALEFHRRWGRKIHSFYGASECGGICFDDSDDPGVAEGYVGRPMQGVEIHPVEQLGSDILPEIRSAAVGLGYEPAEADGPLREGRFRPSDLLRREGEGYVIAGRLSDFINVSGRKVNPAEIERILRQCPGVPEAVVLGCPDGTHGEIVVAVVAGDARESEIREFCAQRLPSWQVPRRWIAVTSLPRTGRGKLDRPALRRLVQQSAEGQAGR